MASFILCCRINKNETRYFPPKTLQIYPPDIIHTAQVQCYNPLKQSFLNNAISQSDFNKNTEYGPVFGEVVVLNITVTMYGCELALRKLSHKQVFNMNIHH